MQRFAAAPHIAWSVLFIVIPLLFIIYYTFTDAAGGFTLENLATIASPEYLMIFLRSVMFSILATVICLLIGYPLAYRIASMKPRTQRIVIVLVMLPMWLNFLIRTYCLKILLNDQGIINTFLGNFGIEPLKLLNTSGAVIFAMVYNYLPYMILPIYTVISKMDQNLLTAAADLGCNRFQTMTKVVLPLSFSGIMSGVTMVFVPSISTFYISDAMGGRTFSLIGDTIERQFKEADNYNVGSALSLVLMILIIISMSIMNKYSDDDGGVVV
ncbi:MAG: ABC transporter permease [Clostridia bacterium]|nr:ABC transporter permease [Clostridia bacterium]